MKNQKTKARVLEAFLRYWEDTFFMRQVTDTLNHEETTGTVKHWSEFRQYARDFRLGQLYDLQRFHKCPKLLVEIQDFAAILLSWITYSKRVFRISKEMQARFEMISLGNIMVSDIVLPFPAFGVELDTEMEYAQGDAFDFMVVSNYHELIYPKIAEMCREKNEPLSAITTYSSAQTTYRSIPATKKKEIMGNAQRGYSRHKDLARDVAYLREKAIEGGKQMGRSETIIIPVSEDCLAEDFLAKATEMFPPEDVRRIRVIFNLCLYLQSLPAQHEQEEGKKWKEEPFEDDGTPSGSTLTRSANLCDIVGRHILDSMLVDKGGREVLAGSGWELPPHWRRAHKRRPPGKGSDPNAEKSVKVRHSLVRADRVPEFGGVIGSVAEVVR
jgi:hypothetical protein